MTTEARLTQTWLVEFVSFKVKRVFMAWNAMGVVGELATNFCILR
jgi:hypothetical protein